MKQANKEQEFIRLVYLLDYGLTYTRLYYRKTAGIELDFNKRRHRRIQRILKNQLKNMEV